MLQYIFLRIISLTAVTEKRPSCCVVDINGPRVMSTWSLSRYTVTVEPVDDCAAICGIWAVLNLNMMQIPTDYIRTKLLEKLTIQHHYIMDWRQYYTTTSIGWMSWRALSASLVWQCTGVCMDRHLSTSQITSSQPLMLLLAVVVYDVLQTWTVSLCLAADFARTVAGHFIMLARQSATRC